MQSNKWKLLIIRQTRGAGKIKLKLL